MLTLNIIFTEMLILAIVYKGVGNTCSYGGGLAVVVLQSLKRVQHFATPWTASWQASLSFAISWSLLKLMSIASVMASHSLSSPSPPAFTLSQHHWSFPMTFYHFPWLIGLFQWVSSSHQVAKYWSFSFSINPSSEYSGLISFRMDWFDILAG